MERIENTVDSAAHDRYPRYAEYRDSGIGWVGDIPAHWDTARLHENINLINGYPFASDLFSDADGFPLIRIRDLLAGHTKTYYMGDIVEDALVGPNDILIGMDGDFNISWWNDDEALLNQRVCCVRTKRNLDQRFLYYVLPFPLKIINDLTWFTTVKHLSSYDVLKSKTPLPPVEEQRTIATFLDRETTKIDDLIAKKEHLIELLQEQRSAIISHAVTKGLDPDAPMKDSGVEWLGEIPAHWASTQFKYIANIQYGIVLELDRTFTDGTKIISLPNVTKDGRLLLDEVPTADLSELEKNNNLLERGDLLFNWRNGSSDHVGKTAYFDEEGEYTHVSFLLRLRLDLRKNNAHYFQLYLTGLREMGFFSSSKTGVNNTFNQSELRRLEVLVPPLEEQNLIVQVVSEQSVHIDTTIAKNRQLIDTLREYRTALISAAVTGKIDVRDKV
jgi:type I restriction enzyme, S subunit